MFIRYRTRVPDIMIGAMPAPRSTTLKIFHRACGRCSWLTGLIRGMAWSPENGMQVSRDARVKYLVPALSFALR